MFLIAATGTTTAAFTNTKNTTSVEATKAWTDNGTAIQWPEDVKEIKFTLYKTVNGVKSEVSTTDVTGIVNPATVDKDTTGLKAMWPNLPKKYWMDADPSATPAVAAGWYEATYTVEETKVILSDDSELESTAIMCSAGGVKLPVWSSP